MNNATMPTDASRARQCGRLLEALRHGPMTTTAARALLGSAANPAARVSELRKHGYRIEAQRTTVITPAGQHREALYVLRKDQA